MCLTRGHAAPGWLPAEASQELRASGESPAANELWPGVRGLELGPLAVKVGRDGKLVVYWRDGSAGHLTMMFATQSGEIDFHWTTPSGHHHSLVRLHADSLEPVLNQTGDAVAPMFLRALRPLRAGWLGHHRIGIAVQPYLDARALQALGTRRARVVRVEPSRLAEAVVVPDSLEAIYELVGSVFVLVATRRLQAGRLVGYAFSHRRPDGLVVAHWIKTLDFMRFGSSAAASLKAATVAQGGYVANEAEWAAACVSTEGAGTPHAACNQITPGTT